MITFFECRISRLLRKKTWETGKGAFVFDHVSIGLETEDDLWQLKTGLTRPASGCPRSLTTGFIHSNLFYDSERHPIEIQLPCGRNKCAQRTVNG